MKKGHLIFELVLMGISAIMMLLLLFTQNAALLYFLAWQALLGIMQFVHALVITYYFRKDLSIRRALRIYWLIAGIALVGLALRKEQWFSEQLYVFTVFVLPWFNAIYLTMLTYRYTRKTVTSEV